MITDVSTRSHLANGTPSVRGADQLRGAAEHLLYEVWMMRETALALATSANSRVQQNALIESFAIHVRALLHFLFASPSSNDDVVADHFVADGEKWRAPEIEPPIALQGLRVRANKEIAHLTYTRLSLSEEAKRWNVSEIVAALDEVIGNFARRASLLTAEQRAALLRST